VKRTFSKEPQFSTGLSREKTLKADRQKVGNFFEVISVGGAGEHWNHPVARLQMLSLLRKNQKNLSLSESHRKGNNRYADESTCLRNSTRGSPWERRGQSTIRSLR
jgi:hypothetical protein